MKSFIISILLVLYAGAVAAQDELKVKSFMPTIGDLTASTQVRKGVDDNPCGLIKVVIADPDVVFEGMIIGDVSFHTNEYWIYLPTTEGAAAKHLKIKHPKYQTIDVVFADYGFSTLQPRTTYTLVLQKPKATSKFAKNNYYIQPFVQIGTSNGVGISAGGYIHNFNIEAFYAQGLGESEEIFWISSENTGNSSSYSYTYKSSKFGGKVGYGILLGERFRFTPQIGVSTVLLKGTEVEKGTNDPKATNGYTADIDISMKADFYVAKWLTIGITPEYSVAMNESDLFGKVATVSPKVNDFGSGFNMKVAITLTF